jgi:hypothetical protein
MASKKEGADISQVESSRTRNDFLRLGATVVSSQQLSTGELVETYQIPKERGSAARAVMHGLLDVSTLGLWEIAGTPIEGNLNKPQFFTVKVTYNLDGIATKAELIPSP